MPILCFLVFYLLDINLAPGAEGLTLGDNSKPQYKECKQKITYKETITESKSFLKCDDE